MYTSKLSAFAKRPGSQSLSQSAATFFMSNTTLLRTTFSLSSWILLGAFLQSLIVLAVPRLLTVLPIVLILGGRLYHTMAITWGWKSNPYLDEAIPGRVAAQVPDSEGNFQVPNAEKITVFILGFKLNHPLGMFAPHAKEIGMALWNMIEENDLNAAETGYLGSSTWQAPDKRGAFEYIFITYWRSTADVHRYAYGPVHKKAWDYWIRHVPEIQHLGINHELYEVDRQHWEGVYINFQPTNLGATTFLRQGDKMIGGTVDDIWISPLVEASKGKLRSSAGRLGRQPEDLYNQYDHTPGDDTKAKAV